MSRGNQPSAGTVTLVGMDAHTRILSLCIAEWRHGEDPKVKDRLPQVMLEDMEKVYESRVPKDAVTLIESSGNTRIIVRRLEAIGRRVEVLNSDILGSISERDRVNDRIDAEKLAYAYARGVVRALSARRIGVCGGTRRFNLAAKDTSGARCPQTSTLARLDRIRG